MPEEIDPLAAAAYADEDTTEVAVSRVASILTVRDGIAAERRGRVDALESWGSTAPWPIARKIVASLRSAGWQPPAPERVHAVAQRAAADRTRYKAWFDSLTAEDRARVVEHYSEHGNYPADLQPPEP
ncbi:hypothetical protein LQ327_09660 [Actinomycetospora endophytica]|uniref:Uncharacterized protein n=1 Tax=Actinomycetospora endophytica TaxID=2291215 RepID=A0ABS8P5V8_9PSEU|nr:hypothetical protein [Actinomycetospora endophytica]MCD2193647.1 hypothetical protein [Actinomycetospora endophytica]